MTFVQTSAALDSAFSQATPLPDELALWAYKTPDELFSIDRTEVEAWQLAAIRRRFDEMHSSIAALADQAAQRDVTRIDSLNGVVPLLFEDSVYKSYPLSLLEKNRFDLLTRWLSRICTVDLAGVDVTSCESIDGWLDTLEAQTNLRVYHTSGTSGKLSFLPRTTLEFDLWNQTYLQMCLGFGNEPGVKLGGANGERMPVIYPSLRHGRYITQRLLTALAEHVAPSPEQCYTLTNGTLSADLISLTGRIRVAQAKGELSQMKLPESQRAALKQYLESQARRGEEMGAFFERMIGQLNGKRVFIFAQNSYLFQASQEGLSRGISGIFTPDSIGITGGGGKDIVLPPDWLQIAGQFTGISTWRMGYAMTELTGPMSLCPQGRYHIPPYFVPFLLDPYTGAVLPRHGTRTGRFAAFDILAQHYWGGVVTGDEITIEWDQPCGCGRKGPHIHQKIARYEAKIAGDDKITCAETVDNTDSALQALLAGKRGN